MKANTPAHWNKQTVGDLSKHTLPSAGEEILSVVGVVEDDVRLRFEARESFRGGRYQKERDQAFRLKDR